MYPSSELCRRQERLQLDRADATALDNVRRLATNAARIWHQEALVAEKREMRQAQAKLMTPAQRARSIDADFLDDED
jgi:hypothetical protein